MNANQIGPNREREVTVLSGWLMLAIWFGLLLFAVAEFASSHDSPLRF